MFGTQQGISAAEKIDKKKVGKDKEWDKLIRISLSKFFECQTQGYDL